MKCQKKLLKISGSSFSPTFIACHVLPDINFNGCCLINNICIPKKEINSYISYTLSQCLRNLKADFIFKIAYLDL